MSNSCDPQVGGAQCWDLSPHHFAIVDDHYISAPTALKRSPAASDFLHLLLKYPPALQLSEGRISTWWRATSVWTRPWLMFLSTAAPGDHSFVNSYVLFPDQAADALMELQEYQDGIKTRAWTNSYARPDLNLWHRWRASWYLSFGSLIVEVETWDGAAWVNLCDPFTVTNPLHLDTNYQRPGILARCQGGHHLWLDDTIVSTI